jgi:putative ABC transport system substrate-binding protein
MNRRAFIALLGMGTTTAWPNPVLSQQRVPRVGILRNGEAAPPRDIDLVKELAALGYIEGRNISYEVRAAGGDPSRLAPLARELVASRPDVLIGSAVQAATALFGATRDIPIVMTAVGDPVALGLSGSISRPTHNVTGFTISTLSLAAKRLELLHGTIPGLRKVAYLWVPGNPLGALFEAHVRKAAEVLGVSLLSLPLTSQADIAKVFAAADNERVSAVLVESDPLTLRFSANIVDECLVRDLPGMHSWPVEARNGALMSYGPAEIENNARVAVYVDRILKGARVADLPFEEPTQFKLVINLRTAHSIKLALPPSVLARADEVIE